MNRRLLDVLACPACGATFTVEAVDADSTTIRRGALTCAGCAQSFPIERGVPRLLVGRELDRTREGFSAQWRLRARDAFEPGRKLYGQDIDALVGWFFAAAFGPPRSGDWLLDAGCGTGEKALAAARQHPELEVVALDMVDTLDDTAARCAGVPNLHFVQGDVTASPFRPRCFQNVVSWGVLHHTRNTRDAFDAVARLVAPSGHLLVWIYPAPSEDPLMRWYYRVRDWHFLGLGPRLNPAVRLWLVRAYCLVMAPALYYLYRTAFVPRYRNCPYVRVDGIPLREVYESTCFLFYDCLTPELQFRHARAEVLGWFPSAGLVANATDGLGHYWGERRPEGGAVTAS